MEELLENVTIEDEKLSVIILTFNRKQLLGGCLESLLSQNYSKEKIEIIVIDDGSVDGTGEMVSNAMSKHANLRYVYQPHQGIPAARNSGIRHAAGTMIAFVADDYLLEPDYAKTIMDFFRNHQDAVAVRFKVIAADDSLVGRINHFYFDASIKKRLRLSTGRSEEITTDHDLDASGGATFRRTVFEKVGLFDESLQRVEDTDLARRMRAQGLHIYYNPLHAIKHRYNPSLRDTIRKCFLTGIYRYDYYSKYSSKSLAWNDLAKSGAKSKISAVFHAYQSAKEADSLGVFIISIPFLFIFESTNKLGFLLSMCYRALK